MTAGRWTGGHARRLRQGATLTGLVAALLVLGPLVTNAPRNTAATAQPVAGKAAVAPPASTVPGATGLPLPRFVSLKSDEVNLRRGPARDHEVAWIFKRAGLPVEITAEWEQWRRIRDADGTEGWVYHSMLSGRRTATVAPWSPAKAGPLPLHRSADASATVVARLEPGVQASVSKCTGSWCRIRGDGFDGWMEQDRLWGVYPGEKFD
jgi:SH3-like domain-containing protein